MCRRPRYIATFSRGYGWGSMRNRLAPPPDPAESESKMAAAGWTVALTCSARITGPCRGGSFWRSAKGTMQEPCGRKGRCVG